MAAGHDVQRKPAALRGLLFEHGEREERPVTGQDDGGGVERGKMRPGGGRAVGCGGHLEDGGLGVGCAGELYAAAGPVEQSPAGVGVEGVGCQFHQWRFAAEGADKLGAVGPDGAAGPGPLAHRVRAGTGDGEGDRLAQQQPAEQAGAGLVDEDGDAPTK